MSVASRRRARGMWLLSGFGGSGAGSGPSYDTDAQTYITAVESADGQSLETGVKDAINAFVVGCKSDGIWTAIKASCILAGARTLSGALVPLVGTAPTNNNFVSGDYSRTGGLTGDGSTKWLDSNRAANSDLQDDMHRSVYLTSGRNTASGRYISGDNSIYTLVGNSTDGFRARVNSTTLNTLGTGTAVPSLIGVSRESSLNYDWRGLGQSGTQVTASTGQGVINVRVFTDSVLLFYISSTLAFYSIGESLDLADLDTRVTTLIDGLAFAVNTGLSPIGYSTETIRYVNAGYAAGGTLA